MRCTRFLLALLLVWCADPAAFEPQSAESATPIVVSAIVDGDTVWIEREGTRVQVRLYGVDAPEGPQDFGREATAFTSRLLLGRRVVMTARGSDRHDRIVAALAVDGRDVGEMLVRSGLAWHDTRFAPAALELAGAERAARDARRGLWATSSPQPPWAFRRAAPPASSSDAVAYRGNRNSRVFHAPGCLAYDCANCTIPLSSIDEARARGFRPHAACVR